MRDILLLAFTAVASVVALANPAGGFLAYTFYGVFGPQSMTWGVARNLPLAKIIGLATIAGFVLSKERKGFPVKRETILLVFLLLVFGISTIFAVREEAALQQFSQVAKIVVMTILGAAMINTQRRLRLFLYVIVLSIGFYAVKGGVFTILTKGQYFVWGPEDNYLRANNSIGLAMAINLPLAYFLARTEERFWLRAIFWAVILLSVPAIVCTFSRGAWLGMAVALGLIVLHGRKRIFLLVPGGILLLLAALVLLPAGGKVVPQTVAKRYGELVDYKSEASAQSRFWNWELCWRVGKANPATGAGFDYYSIEVTSRYYPEFLRRWPGKVWSCHSMWFSIFGEHGVAGFALWVGLLASSLLSLRRIRKAGKRLPGEAWLVDYAGMTRASLLTYMVVGTFLDAAYFEVVYQIIMSIIAAQAIVQGLTAAADSTEGTGHTPDFQEAPA